MPSSQGVPTLVRFPFRFPTPPNLLRRGAYHYPGMRGVIREQVTEPVNTFTRGPRPFTVAVEAVDGDDTDEGKQ